MRMNMHKMNKLRHHHVDSEEKFLNQKEQLYHDHPVSDVKIKSVKNGIIYIALAWLTGILGLHNFYAGYYWRGAIQLVLTLTSWLFMFIPLLFTALWSFLELLLENRAADGRLFGGNRQVILGIRLVALLWLATAVFYSNLYINTDILGSYSEI